MTTHNPKETKMATTTASPLNAADRIAPAPTSREGANRTTWVKHYAAQALACWATFRAEHRNLTPNPEPGSRPDLGYLTLAAVSATTVVAALVAPDGYHPGNDYDHADTPKLIWDLTPEAGALNGEWEEWLAEVLVCYGVNPGDIDPDLDPADFTEAMRTRGPRDEADADHTSATDGGLSAVEQLQRELVAATAERDQAFAELDHVSAALNRAGVTGPGSLGDRIDATAEALAALRARLAQPTEQADEAGRR